MTQEEKSLLLQDLCARLPYGVKIELMPITRGKCTTLTPIILRDYYISDDVNYLPYLRPISSMTEEEHKYFRKLAFPYDFVDALNKNHFDYRGLIEKGLALEAPEGMYNLKLVTMTTIKKIILLALTALIMVGCTYKSDAEREEQKRLNGFNIKVVDSCEYLYKEIPAGYAGYGFMAHKGNCRFCAERRQKELEELIVKLKEK